MTLIFLPALTPLSYNIVREITLKPQTVNSTGLSIIKGRLCMSETQFKYVGKQPCVSNRYDLSHRQIVPITIYGLKIICFVLIIEKRFKISPMIRSLSLPSQHALESERKVRGFRVHVPRKAQNSVLFRRLLKTESCSFRSVLKGRYCSSSAPSCSFPRGKQTNCIHLRDEEAEITTLLLETVEKPPIIPGPGPRSTRTSLTSTIHCLMWACL